MPDFTSPELPVEDAVEQDRDLIVGADDRATVTASYDASDADVIEQSVEVPLDDDYEP